jgi:hypothetical protein
MLNLVELDLPSLSRIPHAATAPPRQPLISVECGPNTFSLAVICRANYILMQHIINLQPIGQYISRELIIWLSGYLIIFLFP